MGLIISVIVIAVLFLYPLWRIFARAGLPAPLSLLVFLPLGQVIVALILAFARWPNTTPLESRQ
ncbi:hypothetical protein [Pelagibius marinus]|uniref:hypothetical protein n=1 Tax=Pelagibius marinus TaxID=2762760 RepID=UPI0018731679|nr:hypothetical protein [Pelagibius marinus]